MAERFTLLTELGRGGMGVVWKALDEETGQIVALKLLRETYAEDPDYVTRFERELELAKRIHSAHVVEVIGFGARDGVPYLALEFVDGPSLRDLLKDHGPYAWPEAKDLLIQITQGLADAHAAGVIHRDLKPSNILIGPDSVAKLADFGIAKGLDLTRVTGTPTLLGTPAYLAPEGPIDERSDLYSLGIIAYELLTAAAPFAGSTYQEVIVRHIRETPDLAKLPSEARDIVAWLLAKEPAQRPQRASQLMAALYGAGPGPGPAAAAASGPYQPTAPAPLTAGHTGRSSCRACSRWLAGPDRTHGGHAHPDRGHPTRAISGGGIWAAAWVCRTASGCGSDSSRGPSFSGISRPVAHRGRLGRVVSCGSWRSNPFAGRDREHRLLRRQHARIVSAVQKGGRSFCRSWRPTRQTYELSIRRGDPILHLRRRP